jgi:hypothetical protein
MPDMKRRLTAFLLAALLFAFPVFALDTAAIRTELGAIKILVDSIAARLDAPPSSVPIAPPVTVAPVTGNPYADTTDRVRIIPDDHLTAEPTMTASYLQSRFWWQLWGISAAMKMPITVVNACLLEGVPVNNTAHYSDARTVDIRYPDGNEKRIELIRRILELVPVYELPRDYVAWLTDDSEVRIDPAVKASLWPMTAGWNARMRQLYVDRVQADPAGNHDNHMHMRFAE